jgi:inosine/xanthosine triphosphate pyrophosphatase family protein
MRTFVFFLLYLFSLRCFGFAFFDFPKIPPPLPAPLVLGFNSGNKEKTKDYKRIFQDLGIPVLRYKTEDLKEIDSQALDVITHKASQFQGQSVLVDDVSLFIDGADIGHQIKWMARELPKYLNKRALFVTYLACYLDGEVFIFQGSVPGIIVPPRGNPQKGMEFNPYFQPLGKTRTLAETFADDINPRLIASKALLNWNFYAKKKPIFHWTGPWQKEAP